MILKKPYGLLIKYFKVIHLILLLLTIFIAVKTKTIVNFYGEYVANDYYVNVFDNMVRNYISPLLYVAIIAVLIILIALYILLRYKKKPTTFYIATITYYSFLLIMIIISAILIGSLERGLWETVAARQYRDFSQLIYWPQLIFVFLIGVRTLGFDIKKFDFKKDIKELELSEADSELIEVNIGFDTTKARRTFRRLIREFIYYFKENKFIFIIFGILFALFVAYNFHNSYEKLNYYYKQGDNFNYDGFNFKVEDSMLTNLDYQGKKISNDKYYLLVKLTVKNNNEKDTKINYDNFKIYFGKDYFYPSLSEGAYFVDYAEPYYGEKVKTEATKTYLFTYEIANKNIKKRMDITIHSGFSTKNAYDTKKITVHLNPVKVDEVTIAKNASLNEEINFLGTNLNNSNLTITDYTLSGQSYRYTYRGCEECQEYTQIVTSKSTKKSLLVLGYKFNLDKTSEYYASVQTFNSFATNFITVKYTINGTEKTSSIENITPTLLKDKVVLQVNKDILNAQKIDVYITIRNKIYIVNLKNE